MEESAAASVLPNKGVYGFQYRWLRCVFKLCFNKKLRVLYTVDFDVIDLVLGGGDNVYTKYVYEP